MPRGLFQSRQTLTLSSRLGIRAIERVRLQGDVHSNKGEHHENLA